MKKRMLYLILIVIIITAGAIFFMKNLHTPGNAIKAAVVESELYGQDYILCKRARVTGFDWILIKNEDGKKTHEYCNIIGPTPFRELKLEHEFVMANNTFVFYIEEKREYYSEELSVVVLEYVVTGWDVLYPVKHSDFFLFDLFGSKKYITENDLRS